MASANHAATPPIGEIQCLICGRILAEVIQSGAEGRHLLRCAAHHTAIEVQIVGPHGLRCMHCGGRALMQPFLDTHEEFIRTPVVTRAVAA